jgi:transcriptional regulator with XRE-family HTH domain
MTDFADSIEPRPLVDAYRVVPNRIQALRNARGWSRERLAANCGVTINTVARWEAPEGYLTMKLVYVLRVAAAFNLPAVAVLPVLDGAVPDVRPPNERS